MVGGDADPPKGKRPTLTEQRAASKAVKKERAKAFAEQQRAAEDKARTVEVIEAQLAEVQTQLCWERNEERAAELEQQKAALQKELEKKKQQKTDGAESEAARVQQRSGMPYTAPQYGVWRLRDGITLRDYQRDDLARIFATEPAQLLAAVSSSGSESESPLAGPAEGGLIRYPCGAGKTLLLISMALAVKQHVLIVVPDNLISQWVAQLLDKTQLERRDLAVCSCNESEEYVRLSVRARVVVTSFTYLAKRNEQHTPNRPILFDELYKELLSCRFALTLVDECQNMSAETYWEGLQRVPERGELFGATGSLYRESVVKGVPMIETLHQRFAGQRVMLSFKQLMDAGYIARVRIFEVVVPLPPAWEKKLAAGGLTAYERTLHNILSPRLLEQARTLTLTLALALTLTLTLTPSPTLPRCRAAA